MSSSRSNNRASSSARSRHSERVVAQTPVGARLHAEFEGSQRHFDYSSSVNRSGASTSSAVSAYLQNMQRGRYIQPFGCLPNHIVGKGMINKIRALYPTANITPIDYDPSATRVNQENRIKLMLAVAKERLDHPAPAAPLTAEEIAGGAPTVGNHPLTV